jgi:hypothetical protein
VREAQPIRSGTRDLEPALVPRPVVGSAHDRQDRPRATSTTPRARHCPRGHHSRSATRLTSSRGSLLSRTFSAPQDAPRAAIRPRDEEFRVWSRSAAPRAA